MLTRLIILAVLVLSPVVSFAQALADRMPADTVAYVSWAGSESLGDEYAASHFKAVLDASNIPAVITEFLPKALLAMDQQGEDTKEVASVLDSLYRVYRHPFAYGFAGVDWKNHQPKLIFVCEGGADADKIHQTFVSQLAKTGNPVGGEKLPFPVKVTRSGTLVSWSTGYDKPEVALAAQGAVAQSLAGAPAFKAALAQLGKKPVLVGFLDAEKALKLIDRGLAEDKNDPDALARWTKARDAMGLSGAKSAAFASGFDKMDWVTQAFIDAPAPRKGMLAMLDAKPLTDDALRTIPQDAIAAGVFRFDASNLLSTIRTIATEIEPAAGQQIGDGLAQVNQLLKMDVEKDFFGSLGNEWTYYTSPSVGGDGMLGMALVNRLKDPAKATEAIAKLQSFTNMLIEQNSPDPKVKIRIKQTKIGDLTINYLGVPIVTPSWAVHNGNLYVGLFPQIVASAARQGDLKGQSILQNPKFAAMRDRLGAKGISSIQFNDLSATAPQSYAGWLAVSRLVGFGDVFGVDSPPMVLPELSTLMKHLGPAGAVTWSDEAGWHFKSVSPFPGSSVLASDPISQMVVGNQAMAVSILLPALNRVRDQGNKVKSASNLKQIGLGVQMYANDHKGRFPPDLGVVMTEQDMAPEIFINPRSGTQSPPRNLAIAARAAWVKENSDYAYLGAGLKINANADVVVAYEKMDGLHDGINILFADGHVEFVEMSRAIDMIGGAPNPAGREQRIDGGL